MLVVSHGGKRAVAANGKPTPDLTDLTQWKEQQIL